MHNPYVSTATPDAGGDAEATQWPTGAVASALVDREGRHLAINEAFAALAGAPLSSLVGRNLREYCVGREDVLERGLQFMDAGMGAPEQDIRVGGERFRMRLTPVRDPERRIVACLAVIAPVASRSSEAIVRTRPLGREQAAKWIDALTGLSNERYLSAALVLKLWQLRLATDSLSLVCFEVDGLTDYLAPRGGIERDDCLRLVGESAAGVARRSEDFVCRLNDWRFMMVLPHTDATGAHRVAERTREAILQLNITSSTTGQPITVRTAVASTSGASPHRRRTRDELIAAAHAALDAERANPPRR